MQAPGGSRNPGPPTSFKTNVNRAKTKRWVEAKSYSYDGDDWGEVDDYDEYGGYDEPGPPQKPTGLRQQGQSASPATSSGYGATYNAREQPDESRPTYEPTGQQGYQQQQHQPDARPIASAQLYDSPSQERSTSFNRGDEARSFSAGGFQQPGLGSGSPNPVPILGNPQTRRPSGGQQFYQQPSQSRSRRSIDGQQPQGIQAPPPLPPANYRGVSYSDRPRVPGDGSRTQSMTSNTSSLEFQNRRDFSASAMPQPLHTTPRGLPPRNSSLGQDDAPAVSVASYPSTVYAQPVSVGFPHQETDTNAQAPTDTAVKPLPFVRPADIYKRMQEEREKERKSQESSRPSMDAIMETQPPLPRTEISRSANIPEEKINETWRGAPRPQPSFETGDDANIDRLRNQPNPSVLQQRENNGTRGHTLDPNMTGSTRLPTSNPVVQQVGTAKQSPHRPDGSPLLPEVTRMSGFGESFLGSLGDSTSRSQPPATKEVREPSTQVSAHLPSQNDQDASLQHQPSLGFRSVVNKAFEDQVPPTPSSTAGSAVARSNSESTNDISPIISRAPSAANPENKARDAEARGMNISVIAEEPTASNIRPISQENAQTPIAVPRKSSPSRDSRPASSGSMPASFLPGHRRKISTPSPDNSPARTPALEVNSQLRQPQEVELAMTTPTSMTHSSSSASNSHPSKTQGEQQVSENVTPTKNTRLESPTRGGDSSSVTVDAESPLRRADSPSKNRVRDLAGKFESPTVSRPGSQSSLKDGNFSTKSPVKDDSKYAKPPTARYESFRPQLPGGWDSYASTAPTQPGLSEISRLHGQTADIASDTGPDTLQQNLFSVANDKEGNGSQRGTASPTSANEAIDLSPTTVKHSLSNPSQKEESNDPFSAVAAAGSALAGAIVSAVGMEYKEDSADKAAKSSEKQSEDFNAPQGHSASMGSTDYHPDASKPWIPATDDGDSSIVPTPVAKDSPGNANTSGASAYFPPFIPLKQKPRNVEATNIETPSRPHILPALSTETSPHDYESDRLRKEIVRELSPHADRSTSEGALASQAPTADDTMLSVYSGSRGQSHDSMVLPREYDSYWNGSSSGDDVSRPTSHQQAPMVASTVAVLPDERTPVTLVSSQLPGPNQQSMPVTHDPSQSIASSNTLQVRPDVLKHRFSWEPEPEEIISPPSDVPGPQEAISHPDSAIPQEQGNPKTSSYSVPDQKLSSVPDSTKNLPNEPTEKRLSQLGSPSLDEQQPSSTQVHENASQAPPQESMPLPPLPSAQNNLPTFREILALRSPMERIQAYNATREQFASMNTGLEHWTLTTINDLPEHGELLKNGGNFPVNPGHKPSPSRTKFGGLRSASGQNAQQPYYQQYLNASSQPVQPHPASSAQGSSSGFSPSPGAGNKMSSQQMQAKGKDLLHSAGVFGGKANVAAKGLFSKGKSKFRGSGGGEKAALRDSPSSSSELDTRGMQPRTTTVPANHDSNTYTALESNAHPSTRPDNSRPISSIFPVSPQDDDAFSSRLSTGGPDYNSSQGRHSGQYGTPNAPSGLSPGTDLSQRPLVSDNNSWDDVREQEVPSVEPNPATMGDSAPIFLKDKGNAESQISSPDALPTPRSGGSSNRTPTQADFPVLDVDIPRSPSVPLHHIAGVPKRHGDTGGQNVSSSSLPEWDASSETVMSTTAGTRSEPLESAHSYAPTDSHDPTQIGGPSTAVRDDPIADSENERHRVSEDSEGTYHTAESGEHGHLKEVPVNDFNDTRPVEPSAFESPKPYRSLPYQNENDKSLQQTIVGINQQIEETQPRPFSFIQFGQIPEDLSLPSLDKGIYPGHATGNPPGVPGEPQYGYSNGRGQVAPIYYDTSHDFTASHSESSSSRSRPRSFSRPFQDPNVHQHPAFRQDRTSTEISQPSPNRYEPHVRRDEVRLPRQRGTEYQLPGVGPPSVEQLSNSARSRQGSRSSTFFNGFSSSSKEDGARDSFAHDPRSSNSPPTSQIHVEKRGKRASLFRSLTSHTGSDSSRSRENSTSRPNRSRTEPQEPSNVRPSQMDKTGSSRHKIAQSFSGGHHSSPSNASTSETGKKKKRFSSLGAMFGRSEKTLQRTPTPTSQSAYQTPPMHHRLPSSQRPRADKSRDYERVSPPAFQTAYNPDRHVHKQPPVQSEYASEPLEGYYSPDRKSGTFSANFINGQRSPSATPSQGVPAYARPKSYIQEMNKQAQAQQVNPSGYFANSSSPQSPHNGMDKNTIRQVPSNHSGNPAFNPTSPNVPRSTTSHSNRLGHYELPNLPMTRADSPPPPPPPKDERYLPSPKSQPFPGVRSSFQDTRSPISPPLPPHQVKKHSRQSLPPLQTSIPASQKNPQSAHPMTPAEVRKARQLEIERTSSSAPAPAPAQRSGAVIQKKDEEEEEEEKIVMSSSSYPGQEWQPGYGNWDGD